MKTGVEARDAVRDLAASGVDFVKVHAAIPRDAFFGAVDEARKRRLRVAGHLPRAVSAADASDAGQNSMEHIDTLFDGKLPETGTAQEVAGVIARFRMTEAAPLFDPLRASGHMVYANTLREYLSVLDQAREAYCAG